MKNKNILVFGSTGFIGRSLMKRLLQNGDKLICPVRNANRVKRNITDLARATPEEARTPFAHEYYTTEELGREDPYIKLHAERRRIAKEKDLEEEERTGVKCYKHRIRANVIIRDQLEKRRQSNAGPVQTPMTDNQLRYNMGRAHLDMIDQNTE